MVTPIEKYTLGNPCNNGHLDKDDDENDDDDEISLSSDDEIKLNNGLDRKNSQSVWFRAQKRIVGRVLQNDQSIKSIIGKRAYESLKSLRSLMKLHIKPEKDVKQLYKYLIKTIGKIGVISKQQNLTEEDYTNINEIKEKSRIIGLTLISFAQTEYTYNYNFIKEQIDDCKEIICQAVSSYLSQKSIERIKHVFNVLSSSEFLDSVYDPKADEIKKAHLRNLAKYLSLLLEQIK
ncbi:Tumor necrosis factor alpha-induced protein 8-like protein 3 [Schistosoma haematobium]|uniref:Tumor necrosis factor alpha-induced protein 8 n=1 Tax=Schistosoma haematobium TaxID=6185 RepID=A0A095CDD0_SCHHA|nr:Tumor necrosis factor alpha-induced protein 8-like protein 3 [Schistosoma haematobium]KAH9596737.1 Tumor necrosis factor alpha-induced protein 8-like protein 3 [Schistosoma haematobium]CAH8490007.1 unnamed protein product [Schistosoma haematobium]CAH8491795.1 unnamed protein product [Schistosoma haematobium]